MMTALRRLRYALLVAAMVAPGAPVAAATRAYTGPVIDVHLHAATADINGPAPNAICVGASADLRYDPRTPWGEAFGKLMAQPPCAHPIIGPATDDEVLEQTVAQLEKYDVHAILSSDDTQFAKWSARAPGRFRRGLEFTLGASQVTPDDVAARFKRGEVFALAEVTNQYAGALADDPRFEPYWAMAEANDIPVGIHIGVGPPGSPLLLPAFRIQSPRQLESVLTRHPKVRVYAMHAGYPFGDDMKAMLYMFPQLYVDTGVLQMAIPRAEYYAYLENLVRAGFGDRIMFGSDEMNWPGLVGAGIDAINDAPFLSVDQKRAILHDNAVRFFRLEPGK